MPKTSVRDLTKKFFAKRFGEKSYEKTSPYYIHTWENRILTGSAYAHADKKSTKVLKSLKIRRKGYDLYDLW